MKQFTRITGAAVSLLLAVSAFAAPQIGETAPDFTLPDAAGKQHTLSAYQGRVVVLEWTNPDCPYVVRHYQEKTMTTLANAFPDTKVVWLAINTTHYNNAENSAQWTAEHELPYPTLLDPDGAVGRLYRARTTPHMFVVAADGTLIYNGAIDDDPRGQKSGEERLNYVRQAIEATLAGQSPTTSQARPYGCSVKYAE